MLKRGMLKRILFFYILLMLSLSAFSKPARPGRIYLHQPDGSGFYARFYGDEMTRVKVTDDGASVIQEDDGWWCYAGYEADGSKVSTGYRVGDDVPYSVMTGSRDIPFAALAESASAMRTAMWDLQGGSQLMGIREKVRTKTGQDGLAVKYGLVILVQFKGEKERFTYKKEDFVNLLMQDGYSEYGADGSAKEYFDDQFKGKFEFSFDVTDVITLDKDAAYYGGNDKEGHDKNPHMMVVEACQLADAEVDFSRYDQDGDGEVDNVFIFFAGEDEADGGSENQIWSHSWYIRDGAGRSLILDGVRINRYACASELQILGKDNTTMTSIGTFCHEYAHTFGLPDLYDTDYQIGGLGAAAWHSLALMDGGNYNNNGNTPPNLTAVEREFLQLDEPEMLQSSGEYTLEPIETGHYFRIDSDNDNEYFLLECRSSAGWDRFIGGEGMLLYHIDRSMNSAGYSEVYKRNVTATERWGNCNEVNAFASHQCVDLVEADGRKDVYDTRYDETYRNYCASVAGVFYPAGGTDTLTPSSMPGFGCWGDASVGKAVSDIVYDGRKVSFTMSGFSAGSLPIPSDLKADVFQDAAIITFTSSYGFDGSARVVCEKSGETIHTVEVKAYETGRWACVIEGLDSSVSYTVYVNFTEDDYVGEKIGLSFMTKRKQNSGYPYMYLANVDRADNGGFPIGARLPLRLFNVQDAKEVRWTFNGEPVSVGHGCYYVVERKGTLRAHILWEDGSEEIVMKEINIGEIYDE